MKFKYYLRVFFISVEFLCLLSGFAIFLFWGEQINELLIEVKLNTKALDAVYIYPISVTVWMLSIGKTVLFPDEATNKILHQWNDYWKLKVHFNVGIFYSLFLCFINVLIWLFGNITSSLGALAFVSCFFAISVSALSFYQANLSIRELLIHAKTQ
jgi:hypothetical protein